MLEELFATRLLEGEPIPEESDVEFPLRPFAAELPQDDFLNTEPASDEAPVDRLYRRAAEAANRGRTAEAIHRYRELLAMQPGHVPARSALAGLLEAAGDPDEALDQLSQALRTAPDDAALLISRGAIYGRLKRYADAEADLRRALRHDPESVEGHLALALTLWRRGLPHEAAEILRRATTLEPDNATAHYYLGEALNQAGDYSGACAALARSTELAPRAARGWRLLGRVLDRLNRSDEARLMYQKAREAPEQ